MTGCGQVGALAVGEQIERLSKGAGDVAEGGLGGFQMALMSLEERPDLNTAYAISTGTFGLQQISTEEIEAALRELEVAGLVVQSISSWRLVNQSAR